MTLEKQEINRIETAKAAIGTAIAGKGVAVPSGTKLDGMAALIEDIEQGSDPVLQSKTVSPTTSAQTVKPDSGYDALSQVTVNAMPTATQATPSISVSSGGLITASATQSAGYVAAGTKNATKQLTVQAAQTITPGTSNKTIASGRYLTGTQTIKGDANLKAANIAKGVSIFGVNGTHESGEDVSVETAQYTSLLTDLETAIDALPEAGSGGGSGGAAVKTCSVKITVEDNVYFMAIVHIFDQENGILEAIPVRESGVTVTNVACGSAISIITDMDGFYFEDNGEMSCMLQLSPCLFYLAPSSEGVLGELTITPIL